MYRAMVKVLDEDLLTSDLQHRRQPVKPREEVGEEEGEGSAGKDARCQAEIDSQKQSKKKLTLASCFLTSTQVL